LALLNGVTWLNQHAIDPAAVNRIDVKRFARNYAGANPAAQREPARRNLSIHP
jgi:hypothetical protein